MKNVPNYYGETPWADKLPDGDLELCEENLLEFFETMKDRMDLWDNRRKKKEKPWCNNEILENNKFTNVYRELDRNSQYQISQIIMDDELDDITLIWKMLFYRIYNNPNTFQYIENTRGYKAGIPPLLSWNKDEFISSIQELRAAGENPFTNAYLINSMACPGKTRDWCYTNKVIPTLFDRILEIYDCINECKRPEELIKLFCQLPGISNFVSHEFYQDLTYIERYTDRTFFRFNQDDFTNVGPGCDLGIRLIFPNRSTKKEKLDAIHELRDLANDGILEDLGFKFLSWNKDKREYKVSKKGKITLHQVEMFLCEFQKYWKMKIGEGKQRSKFNPNEKGKDYSFYLY